MSNRDRKDRKKNHGTLVWPEKVPTPVEERIENQPRISYKEGKMVTSLSSAQKRRIEARREV